MRARAVVIRGFGALCVAMTVTAASSAIAVDCLNDGDVEVVARSIYTRSIGRVMRTCANQHRDLDERARDATSGFLTSYAEQMRANRLAANSIMMRLHGESWNEKFETYLLDLTAADEMRARVATREECAREISALEALVAAADYAAVMGSEAPRRVVATQRAAIPSCD